jgi:hypothetical protein
MHGVAVAMVMATKRRTIREPVEGQLPSIRRHGTSSAIKASQNSAYYLRNMARAALRCGHLGAAIAGFEVAEGLDAKAAADPDQDDDVKTDLLSDREYLVVAYDRTNQPVKAAAICTKAHADWKACHCELTDAEVKCSGAPVEAVSKK